MEAQSEKKEQVNLNFTIRLQNPWDLDLITLSRNPNFNFTYWMEKCIQAWDRGDNSFRIPRPEPNSETDHFEGEVYTIDENNNRVRKRPQLVYNFHLSYKNDFDIIQRIQSIPSGYRNTYLKQLFRYYLDKPYFYCFGSSEMFKNIDRDGESLGSVEIDEVIPDRKKTGRKKKNSKKKEVLIKEPETKVENSVNGDESVVTPIKETNIQKEEPDVPTTETPTEETATSSKEQNDDADSFLLPDEDEVRDEKEEKEEKESFNPFAAIKSQKIL